MKSFRIAFLFLLSAVAQAQEPMQAQEQEPIRLLDPDYAYAVTSPPGWDLYPEDLSDSGLRALFFQLDAEGEPTGATLSIRVYEDQVHKEFDFTEFAGIYHMQLRSAGLETEDITRLELGVGEDKQILFEYEQVEEGERVFYQQHFYRLDPHVLLLTGKDLARRRIEIVQALDVFFQSVEKNVDVDENPEELEEGERE